MTSKSDGITFATKKDVRLWASHRRESVNRQDCWRAGQKLALTVQNSICSKTDPDSLPFTLLQQSQRRKPKLQEQTKLYCQKKSTHHLTVAGFLPMPGEIDLRPTMDLFLRLGASVIVPRLGKDGRGLAWGAYAEGEIIHRSTLSHLPDDPSGGILSAQKLSQADLIFVPSFAIDQAGYRIGRGAGWYDRALTYASPSAILAGVVWPEEFLGKGESLPQSIPQSIPHDSWDIALTAALLPDKWVWLGSGI